MKNVENGQLMEKKPIKKPIGIFAVGSKEYFKYAVPFWNSLSKFHSPQDIDMIYYTDVDDKNLLAKLPKGIQVRDLRPFLKDPAFYYRQKPVIAEPLMDNYDLVIGCDSDQLVLGNLDYVFNTDDYDIGTVINWNRSDPQVYGFVDLVRIGIAPVEYFNCSFVAMRSKKFVHQWKMLCYSPQFDRVQYREQDILNVLCYYGNFNVRCFDHADGVKKYNAWHGLIGKGEWVRSVIRDGKIIVPKGLGDTPFPPEDMEIKLASLGGGTGAAKDNWATYFPPEVMERIKELTK